MIRRRLPVGDKVVVTDPDPSDAVSLALNDVTKAARRLVQSEREHRRRGYVVIAVMFLLSTANIEWTRYRECASSNTRRMEVRDTFEYMAFFAVPEGSPPTEAAQRDAFVRGVADPLPERECHLIPMP